MYPLVHELFPYLILFCAIDSLVYVRVHQWLMASLIGRRFRLRGPGLHLAGLSPTAQLLLCDRSPLVFTPDGIFVPQSGAEEAPPAELPFHSFETLSDLAVRDRALVAGRRTVWKAPSLSLARHLRDQIAELAAQPPERRLDRLAQLWSAETDLLRIRERRQRQKRWLRALDGISSLCWILTFVVLPVSLYSEQEWRPDALLVAGMVALLGLVGAILAYSALKGLGLSRRERLRALSPMFLFPPAVLHLSSFLWREVFIGFDPLAVAAVLLDPESFRAVARREIRRLRVRLDAAAGAQPHWRLREQVYGRMLSELGLDEAALRASPPATDPSAAGYCPLCSTEYRAGFEVCSDCGSPLERFAPA